MKDGVYDCVHTRFPPEPNGYLHIGHAQISCSTTVLPRSTAESSTSSFDDTNPGKEGFEFVDSIKADVHWLGVDYENRLFYASDYF